ncbi:ABC transporter ATP-binding protein [Phyllobacterium zundukense]|uniref:Spermidine/putrescine import ATP-binding protein PotA n=1 Tax=Phyllobacterium zundukense TaxID=1867719 RepID=A0A2N9W0L3_9HYPH|nr:ABC transporter ATP-binding protein [Phyllobacterium zundukense]ATU95469.1 hypothetical protein BLM14_27715 [Phyllobacterium zundukense]PIO45281.1 hypothetical protein B5P45_08470 [Phyllobacterium zundukense]
MNHFTQSGHSVEIRSLSKHFGSVRALHDVSLDVRAGEFISLLGPSGSGKSTLLMAIAGFVGCDGGQILVNGSDITPLAAERRSLGVVFQGYALFPHMTVAENVAYPLKLRKLPGAEIARLVKAVLDLVKLAGMEDRKPRQLSGGQQQRVALARAFVFQPSVVLLDEPLSALDKQLRSELQFELKSLHERLGTTFINVTHDQEEAMAMSDRVAILRNGKLEQVGTPQDVYNRPSSRFIAEFVGHAAILPGSIVANDNNLITVQCRDFQFVVPEAAYAGNDRDVNIVLRPERLRLRPGVASEPGALQGKIIGSAFLGPQSVYMVETPFGPINVSMPSSMRDDAFSVGSPVRIEWDAGDAILVSAA